MDAAKEIRKYFDLYNENKINPFALIAHINLWLKETTGKDGFNMAGYSFIELDMMSYMRGIVRLKNFL